jgi:hypothetical protein
MTKKEYQYKLDILLDEKDAATTLLQKIKKIKDPEDFNEEEFKTIRAYKNRMSREIRELNAIYNEKK